MPKVRHSAFHNLTDGALADQFGEASEHKARHTALRREVLKREALRLDGEEFSVVISEKPTTTFDHERCRALLGDEQYETLWVNRLCPWVQAFRLVDDGRE